MNSKAGLILRIVAGMYLVFSGATLLRQMLTLRPSDYILKSAIAVLFIVVGVWYGYRNIKATYYFVKGQTEPEKEEKENVEEDRVLYTKPEYDASKYRTAPMPVVEESKTESKETEQDPVKLAIEIMKNEDKDQKEKEAEELEIDFEEK